MWTRLALITLFALGLSHAISNDIEMEKENRAGECVIYLDSSSSFPSRPPIITDENDDFVFPEGTWEDDDRTITLDEGDILKLSCVGNQFANLAGDEYAVATCLATGEYSVIIQTGDELILTFGDLGCYNQPDDSTVVPGGDPCGPNDEGYLVNIGFQDEDSFDETITVCFDELNSRTIWTYSYVWSNIAARDTGNERPDFQPDGFYPFDVDEAYKRDTQTQTVEDLTGVSGYVESSGEVFMSRGHFSPNGDFVYYSHQDATFYFINVAPQWQCFNGGNWNMMEQSVRDFSMDRDMDLAIYTGTHGVCELDDYKGDKVEIWLYPEDDRLPVPKFYWRVVMDPLTNTGAAIIGVNNPHLTNAEVDADYRVCSSIDNHPFLENLKNPNDIYLGIMYVCEVGDAAAAFEEINDLGLGNPGLLT